MTAQEREEFVKSFLDEYCFKVMKGKGAEYCVQPTSRVLTASLEWKEANRLFVGEELIAFEHPSAQTRGTRPLTTKINHISSQLLPCLEIITDKGSVVCSEQHQWLLSAKQDSNIGLGRQRGSYLRATYLKASSLKKGHKISFLVKPWEFKQNYETGYLAAQFDAEGWLSIKPASHKTGGAGVGAIGYAQRDNKALSLVKELLQKANINYKISPPTKTNSCFQIRILGGLPSMLYFLGSLRPLRLLEHKQLYKLWEDRRYQAANSATVLKIRNIGVQSTIGLGTDSETLIIEGLFSHNSRGEFDVNSNFKRVAFSIGSDPLTVAYVYAAKHWDSISNYVKTRETPSGEPIEGRLGDMLNYILILGSLIEESTMGKVT